MTLAIAKIIKEKEEFASLMEIENLFRDRKYPRPQKQIGPYFAEKFPRIISFIH